MSVLYGTTGKKSLVTDSSDFNLTTNDFTINMWMNFTALTYGYAFVTTSNSSTDKSGININGPIGGNNMGFLCGSGASDWDISNNTTMGVASVGVPIMYSITRSGNTFSLYKDGVLSNSFVSALSVANPGYGIDIGSGLGGGSQQEIFAYMWNVEIFNGTALSIEDLSSIYNNNGFHTFSTNKVLDLRMNEQTDGTTVGAGDVKDISGNNHTVTTANSPTYGAVPQKITR